MVDEGTTNDLTVRNRLQIPLGAPQSRKTGDIWYDANITSPGGTSGGGATTRSITVHQESPSEISMYDGSVLAASFSADNTINDITLDGKTIKIPKGVILRNMDGSDSINLEKNALNNAVRFTVKDDYIENVADNRTALALVPVNNHITNIENDVLEKYGALKGMIDNNAELVETEIDETNRKINQTNSEISTQSSRIDSVIEDASLLRNLRDEDSSRISGLKNRITD